MSKKIDVLIVCHPKSDPNIEFDYINHAGKSGHRRATVITIWFGTSGYHIGEQWFINALDKDKEEVRDFAMKDMTNVKYPNVRSKAVETITETATDQT